MIFKFNNFAVTTSAGRIQTDEQIAVPNSISNGKPSDYKFEYKTRQIQIFKSLYYRSKKIVITVFDFIDFIELLKAFNSNKLNSEKTYKFSTYDAKVVSKEKIFYLCLIIPGEKKLYLDKFEASSLAAKFGKILQKLDIF